MKKRQNKNNLNYFFMAFITLIILIVGVIAVSHIDTSRRWHSANDIKVKINGIERTLQQAIDNPGRNLLINDQDSLIISTSPSDVSGFGQNSDEIIVRLGSSDKTLTDAIDDVGACGSSGTYSTTLSGGQHFADEIEVTILGGGIKNLQDAINAGNVLYTKNQDVKCNANSGTGDLYNYDSCGGIGTLDTSCEDSGPTTGTPYCCVNNRCDDYTKTAGCSGTSCVTPTYTPSNTNIIQSCTSFCSVGTCYSYENLGEDTVSGVLRIFDNCGTTHGGIKIKDRDAALYGCQDGCGTDLIPGCACPVSFEGTLEDYYFCKDGTRRCKVIVTCKLGWVAE